MIKKYLKYIGLKPTAPIEQETHAYKPVESKELADRYLQYLKEIDNYQKDRRSAIENKNSQLVGQASIVTSIFALFIPLLIDNLKEINLYIKIPLTVGFLFILIHYLLSIFHAIRTLKINRYAYATRGTITVTKPDRLTNELDFVNQEIKDLVYIINQTSPVDNKKGENLIFGTRCFEIANFGFGIMTFLIVLSTFAIKSETPEIRVNNLKEINIVVPDTVNTRIIEFKQQDSLTIKIDSTANTLKVYQLNKKK